MEIELIIEKFILITVIFMVSLGVAAYSTLAERKIAGYLQDRVGPSRAGWGGMFQPLADGLKMFFKEEIIRPIFGLTYCLYRKRGNPLGTKHSYWRTTCKSSGY
jgi:NADH:ubiquinone oxidoreductase subunit H